jgi:hypothetical protein
MNLINIINEEITNMLNEAYVVSDDRFKFKQQIINSSFFNYEGFSTEFDTDISESNILVNWTVSFWLNQAGIENLIVDITNIEGTYNLVYLNKQTDVVEQDNAKNIAENDWKFIVGDVNLQKGESLYISTLDFNFQTNECTVKF